MTNVSQNEFEYFSNWLPVASLGLDHHAFLAEEGSFFIKLGGIDIPCKYLLNAESDGDVVLHALCNAISGLSGTPILGFVADILCHQDGKKDSELYVLEALKTIEEKFIITHVVFSLEAKLPILKPYLPIIRANIARILKLNIEDIGFTATSGEGLTGMGQGKGIAVLCQLSALKRVKR